MDGKPSETEVLVEDQRETKGSAEEHREPEVPAEEQRETEVPAEEQRETEVPAEEQRETEILVQDQRGTEVPVEVQRETEVPEEEKGEDISPNKDDGVKKIILTSVEDGEYPAEGDEIWVHYVGMLDDGCDTVFDSSRGEGEKEDEKAEPYHFCLGKGEVIKGWEIAIPTMKKGEKARVTIKPEYAYGKTGQLPKIPQDATLIFEIELVDFGGADISEEGDRSLTKRVVEKGEGWHTPNDGDNVTVELTGLYNGKEFENRTVSYDVDEDEDDVDLVEGIRIAVKRMKSKEKSRIIMDPKYAFGSEGNEKFGIPPDAKVEYDVKLADFTSAKPVWEMDIQEKLNEAELKKEEGNKQFKDGKYTKAENCYKRVVSLLENFDEEDEMPRRNKLLSQAYVNTALVHLKQEKWQKAKDTCGKALEIDGENVKAYFRRGQAYMETKDWDKAKDDYKKVLELEKDNRAAQTKIGVCNKKLNQEKANEKAMYKKMFSKPGELEPEVKTESSLKPGELEPEVKTESSLKPGELESEVKTESSK